MDVAVENVVTTYTGHNLIARLWDDVRAEGPRPTKSMPQYKWKECIDNFTANFNHVRQEGATERRAKIPNGTEGDTDLPYRSFLQIEGRIPSQNPYLKEILETPLQLPALEDLDKPYPIVEGYQIIDSYEQLAKLVDAVLTGGIKEVAMDVEHNCDNSYRGMTCLIQFGTTKENYIIDPFSMYSRMHILNKITMNPKILKIFHHADLDVRWLQRDFGIYIINAFDTGTAAKVLDFPTGSSLKKVLATMFGICKEEDVRRDDWRQRPLPLYMLQYAVDDIKYLFTLYRHFGGIFAKRWGTREGKAEVQMYENQVKRIFSRSFNYTPYNIGQEALSLFKHTSRPRLELLILILTWRDIRARHLDVGRHYLISKWNIVRRVIKAESPEDIRLSLEEHRHLEGPLSEELFTLVTAHRYGSSLPQLPIIRMCDSDVINAETNGRVQDRRQLV